MTVSAPLPATLPGRTLTPPPADPPIDLRALTGELVRDLIRRDPALWACLQDDPDLRREFGFDGDPSGHPA